MSALPHRAAWWYHHVAQTREYVNGVFNRKPEQVLQAVEELWKGVVEWGDIISSPIAAALMGEHTILVKDLADSAAKGMGPGELNYLVEYLKRNMDAQGLYYASRFPSFSNVSWHNLFGDHIKYTGAYIMAAAAGDMPEFQKDFQMVLKNRDQLAKFALTAFDQQPAGAETDDDDGGDMDGTGDVF